MRERGVCLRAGALVWLSAAVCMCAAVLPSSALGAWSKPERLASFGGYAFGADLGANGRLTLQWSGVKPYGGGPIRSGIVAARPGAALARVPATPLATHLPDNNLRSVYQLGYLRDGHAVRCWTTGPGGGELVAGVYSPAGALIRTVRLAALGSWVEDGSGYATCRVAVSGNEAVVGWAGSPAPGATVPARYQGVVYVARLLPGRGFSAPVAIPVAKTPLQSSESTWLSSLTLTPTGWVAAGWMDQNWINQHERHLACTYQANVTWLSPDDQPTSPFALTGLVDSHDGSTCSNPPEPALGAVGSTTALVVFQGARLQSELITAGGRTRVEHAVDPGAFPGGVSAPGIVSGGGKIVVVSGGGYLTRTRYVPIRAEEWYRGRWHAPQVVAGALPSLAGSHPPMLAYPAPAFLFVNTRGQAAIVCSAVDSRGWSFGYFGSFDF